MEFFAHTAGIAVLHVALEPTSGVWSVMRDLAAAQNASCRYSAVALGVITSSGWSSTYRKEFEQLDLPKFESETVHCFGTAQFLWQMVVSPPIGAWAEELRLASDAEFVVVHFHNAWLSGVFLPLKYPAAFPAQLVVTVHGVCTTLLEQPLRRRIHRFVAQRLLKYGAILTSVDVGNLPLANRVFGLPPENFTVVPNGVAARPELQSSDWTGEGEFLIGYVGLLAEHKRWRIVADAVVSLRARGFRMRLLIAGAGPQEEQVKEYSERCSEAVEFVGHISNPRESLMARLHVLALISTYEGLPMILIEAASIGLPAIATDVGGVREILQDGVGGKLVEGTVEQVAAALEELYGTPNRLREMGQAFRAHFNDAFEISTIVEKYHDVYLKDNGAMNLEIGKTLIPSRK